MDIPEERWMAHGIRRVMRNYDIVTAAQYTGLMLSQFGGDIVDLERRLIAVERRLDELLAELAEFTPSENRCGATQQWVGPIYPR